MCRSIKTLRGQQPPATPEEVRAAALQFVRKISGFRHPSKANTLAFDRAVEQITGASTLLLDTLQQGARQASGSAPSGVLSSR